MNSPIKIIITIVICVYFGASALAGRADQSLAQFRLSSQEQLHVNEVFELLLTLTSVKKQILVLPDVEGLQISRGTFTEIMSTRGQVDRAILKYEIVASRPGSYTIPSIEVDGIAAQVFTDPFQFEVLPGTDLVRLKTELSSTDLYISELVKVKLSLLIPSKQPLQKYILDIPWLQDFEGFEVREPYGRRVRLRDKYNELHRGNKDAVLEIEPGVVLFKAEPAGRFAVFADVTEYVEEGRKFRAYTIRRHLYPLKPGEIEIPGSSIRCSLRGKQSEVTATSDALKLAVKSLPLPKPEGFSGGVGEYDLRVTLSPESAAVTLLTMQVFGAGYFGNYLQPPRLADSSLFALKEIEPPITSLSIHKGRHQGEKVWKIEARARQEGINKLSPLFFTYFSPKAKAYKTISRGPWQNAFVSDYSDEVPNDASRFTKDIPTNKREQPFLGVLFSQVLLVAAGIVVAGVVSFGLYLSFRSWTRKKADAGTAPMGSGSGELTRMALQQLDHKDEQFWTKLHKILSGYCASLTEGHYGAMSVREASEICRNAGIAEETSRIIINVMQLCEEHLFSSQGSEDSRNDSRQAYLEQVVSVFSANTVPINN
jgi:hypothetical protein